MLDESVGVLGIERVFGHAEATVARWLLRAGAHAERVLGVLVCGARAVFAQLDELRAWFERKRNELWFWKSIDCTSKLWLALHASQARSLEECKAFLRKTAKTLREAPQGASTDGLAAYATLVPKRWKDTSYAQVVKHYENHRLVRVEHKQVTRHTVSEVEWVLATHRLGAELNTSFVERLNATTRAGPAHFHHRTLHYSKREEIAIAVMHLRRAAYNLIRPFHRGPTPAMRAGLTTHPWTWLELLTHQPSA